MIFEEIEELNEIQKGEKQIKLEKFLGGDLKALLNLAGINAANSKYGCLWCKCPSDLYHDVTIEWSITDVEKGARTHEDAEDKIRLSMLAKKKGKIRYLKGLFVTSYFSKLSLFSSCHRPFASQTENN